MLFLIQVICLEFLAQYDGQKIYEDLGYLKFSGNKLTGIIEKPGKSNEPSDLVNLVFHYFPATLMPKFLSLLEETKRQKDDVYESAKYQYSAPGVEVGGY